MCVMRTFNILGLCLLLACCASPGVVPPKNNAFSPGPVFRVNDALFNPKDANTLGLQAPVGAFSAIAYRGVSNVSQYNHGAVLFPFKGRLFLQWQSSLKDEDADDTVVRYSTSVDGKTWADAQVLVPARDNAVVTNGGWWSDGSTLVAYINVWPKNLTSKNVASKNVVPRGGYVEYMVSTDGKHWSAPKRLRQANGEYVNGVIEQDVKALPNGRLLTAVHTQPGLIVKPFYTDDPLGINGWRQGDFMNAPYKGDVSNELEPSWFLKNDGSIVMVFRDQASSFRVLAATSKDNGETWSPATATNMLDSRAKQSAGNLANGNAFIVNNPTGTKTRTPLTVTLSEDGNNFNRAYLLRGTDALPPMRYPGLYKRIGYSYPKSVVWKGFLWVSYGVNKEDIGVTRVPVEALSF